MKVFKFTIFLIGEILCGLYIITLVSVASKIELNEASLVILIFFHFTNKYLLHMFLLFLLGLILVVLFGEEEYFYSNNVNKEKLKVISTRISYKKVISVLNRQTVFETLEQYPSLTLKDIIACLNRYDEFKE